MLFLGEQITEGVLGILQEFVMDNHVVEHDFATFDVLGPGIR